MQIKFKGQTYTKSDLDNIPTDKLIALFNELQAAGASDGKGKQIKTIHTRMKFIPRVWGALEAYYTAQSEGKVTGGLMADGSVQVHGKTVVPPIAKPAPAPKAKAEKKAKEPSVKKGRRAKFADDQVIEVVGKENPKRLNTRAHAKCALLKTGMTVREYLDLEGKKPDLDDELGWARTELRWCVKIGYIKIK